MVLIFSAFYYDGGSPFMQARSDVAFPPHGYCKHEGKREKAAPRQTIIQGLSHAVKSLAFMQGGGMGLRMISGPWPASARLLLQSSR
jgi:hypothetical protein